MQQDFKKKRSGDEGGITNEPKWAYFKSLEFLKDTMHKSKLQGNVTSETTFDDDTQNSSTAVTRDPDDPPANEPNSETQTIESHQNTAKETTPPQSFKAPNKKISKMTNATAEKIQMFKERNYASQNEDPDYHFLMNLLPYLQKIPEERKMIVRTKLQQVFCDEDLLSGFGGQHRLQPIHHPPHYGSSPSGSSTSDTWERR
ncbi:hypothetical protein J6590_041780 [Homalodisca vitripennis]|nr:hypothetical protein J6590_041780 [Homalodisca vitripennis]